MPLRTASVSPADAAVIDPAQMRAHASEAAALLRSLGNEQRLVVLCHLGGGEQSVGALLGQMDLSQSALSQHLAVLREAGLVETRRAGQQVFYAIRPGPARDVLETLYDIYCGPRS
jgi:ArsR family transcriptional regulator, virulence genes transcriptional regulator